MNVEIGQWIDIIRKEYLKDFILHGGSAVKFAVAENETAVRGILSGLQKCSAGEGYLNAHVDASCVRIHMMQHFFFEVARQIPWEELAVRIVRSCYARLGYEVGEDLRFNTVAALRDEEPGPLGTEVRRELQGVLSLSSSMAKDFRYAMLWMCMEKIRNMGNGGMDTSLIMEWLRGDLKLISALKKLLIFRRISRHNARVMLSSLGSWCRQAGYPGLLLTMDIRNLMFSRKTETPEGSLHYTQSAVMDAYEVLRQLIDGTDDLTGILCVVIAPPELFDDEKRGIKVYKALYERIWPDVRLRRLPNPLSALTRVEVGS